MKRLLGTLLALLVLGACGDDKTSDDGGGKIPSKPAGKYATVNKWMYSYMLQNYLWPDPLTTMKTDYSLDYEKFLQSVLDGVAEHKDARGRALNYDDGHWTDGRREYYYSYVKGPEIKSRAGDEVTETGLWKLQPVWISSEQMVFVVEVVTPDSPASRAGLRRGDFISEVDGQTITGANAETLLKKCYYGISVRMLPKRIVSGEVTTLDEVTLSAETFVDPAIYRSTVVPVGGKRVGYLLYMGFESEADRELAEVFRTFRDNNVDELVVDLRYNGARARCSPRSFWAMPTRAKPTAAWFTMPLVWLRASRVSTASATSWCLTEAVPTSPSPMHFRRRWGSSVSM